MTQLHEVLKPIINSPYAEPAQHYHIRPGEPAQLMPGRRPAVYYYRPPNRQGGPAPSDDVGTAVELELVNELRRRVGEWRRAGYPGVTRATDELLRYWQRAEREGPRRLFFCQLEAAETIIFLVEARADLRQGLDIPRDEPGEEARARGYSGFTRYACKMATGSGKTTVMAMLAAWSILNKVNDRSDGRFSDAVLVICPNVTIRDRLQELDPQRGEQSLYRSRDLVPADLMDQLRRGAVIVTNWHVLEPRAGNQVGGVSAAVVDRGQESDTALVKRVLKGVGGKQNILVFNDEAHHAYRLRAAEPAQPVLWSGEEQEEHEVREATVWVEGLDKIHKVRGINFCVDLSATPYYLNNTGNEPGRPFPWVVSDFGLVDAIECGLVKIPQLPIQDTTGSEIPAYFNVWKWIVEQKLTRAEKGGRRGQINPRAVLKYAHAPIAQLAGLWRQTFQQWQEDPIARPTPPVFIIVCRDTRLARVMYDWIALGKEGETAPPIEEFRNRDGRENTVRVDSRVVDEMESGESKSAEARRLRFILETIGKTRWPGDRSPEEWVAIAEGLGVEPLVPPGRDVRCLISVAMLTEGWDATTVTHIAGLRPFESQLLCEQVVGRGLRRSRYDVLDCERVEDIPEEEAKVYGVPFEVIPFKAPPRGPAQPRPRIHHVHAIPEKAAYEIRFPRVERYLFAVRSRLWVDWAGVPRLILDPTDIPPEVTVKGLSWAAGRPTLHGPGKVDLVTLEAWREGRRLQELEFEMAGTLTRAYSQTPRCEVPVQALFPQLLQVVRRFVREQVEPRGGYDRLDLFLNPYYGWAIETLVNSIQPDVDGGEAPEVPVYEAHRGPGSTADVDFWTAREVRDVTNSHINAVVADTKVWEQSAAFYLDRQENVVAFAKNAGLGFAIPYLHDGEYHEYVPDFLARLQFEGREVGTLILETKGHDPLAGVKRQAALRWVEAVNRDGQYGRWGYGVVYQPAEVVGVVRRVAMELARGHTLPSSAADGT